MSELRPERKRRQHERFATKREAILEAAASLIVEKGFENTSLADLASRLNVTKPTLYYYVHSKDQLLFDIQEIGFAAVKSALDAANDNGRTGLEKLEIFLRQYAVGGFTDFGRALVQTGPRGLSAENQERMTARYRATNQMLEEIIQDGIADGTIADVDSYIATGFMFGALNWIAYRDPDWGKRPPPELARDYVSIICAGLLPRT